MHSNPFHKLSQAVRTICGMRSPEGIADLRSRVENSLAEDTVPAVRMSEPHTLR